MEQQSAQHREPDGRTEQREQASEPVGGPARFPAIGTARQQAVLRLQRTVGNAAVLRILAGKSALRGPASAVIQRDVRDVAGQKVDVANDAEAKEAEEIIQELKDKYNIDLNSQAGVDAIRQSFPQEPDKMKAQIETRTWAMADLRALRRALAHFAPILGQQRKYSTRSGEAQEVGTVSAVNQGIDPSNPDHKTDTDTQAQYFGAYKTFVMYGTGGKREQRLTNTATHELAHGLLHYALPGYAKALNKYWIDETHANADPQTGVAKDPEAEAPPTDYGITSADEDMADSVALFFEMPDRLKNGGGKPKGTPGNPCPLRFQLITDIVKDWKRQPNDAPAANPEQATV